MRAQSACAAGKVGYGGCTECVWQDAVDEWKLLHLPLNAKSDRKPWWPREERGFDSVKLDFGKIDSALEEDQVGKTLKAAMELEGKEPELEGICVSVVAAKGNEERLLGRARCYHVPVGKHLCGIFGDIKLANVLRWRGAHELLVDLRIAIGHITGIPCDKMIWAPGRHADVDKLSALGFREGDLLEVMQQSKALQMLADHSRAENETLVSGLAHVDEAKLEEHVERALIVGHQGYSRLGSRCELRQPLVVRLSADLQSVLRSSSETFLRSSSDKGTKAACGNLRT